MSVDPVTTGAGPDLWALTVSYGRCHEKITRMDAPVYTMST